MPKLIKNQPRSLYEIVLFANKNAGVVPTAKQFSNVLGIEERAASARLKRLVESHPDIFIRDGRKRALNYLKVCTEPETARFLLAVYEVSLKDKNGRISMDRIVKTHFSVPHAEEDIFTLIDGLCNAEYLRKVPIRPAEIRIDFKLIDHLDFLKLLAYASKPTLTH